MSFRFEEHSTEYLRLIQSTLWIMYEYVSGIFIRAHPGPCSSVKFAFSPHLFGASVSSLAHPENRTAGSPPSSPQPARSPSSFRRLGPVAVPSPSPVLGDAHGTGHGDEGQLVNVVEGAVAGHPQRRQRGDAPVILGTRVGMRGSGDRVEDQDRRRRPK